MNLRGAAVSVLARKRSGMRGALAKWASAFWDDRCIHDLHHTYASILVSLPIIGAFLGHTQAETTADTVSIHSSIEGETKAATVTIAKECTGHRRHHPHTLTIEPGAFLDGVSCQPQS